MTNTSVKETQVLHLIEKDKIYEDYFFKKVSDPKWFSILNERKYFSVENAPIPIRVKESDQYVIPEWNILPYLERISRQISVTSNQQYIEELIKIIHSVTKYHVKQNKQLDNYRTWWFFVKILINLPNDKIVKILGKNKVKIGKDWLSIWLDSKYDAILQGTEITTKLLPKFLTDNKNDIAIGEEIIDSVTAIKWVKSKIKKSKEEPKTIVDSYWLLKAFKENSEQIGKLCSENVIYKLADKLNEMLKKEHNNSFVLIDNKNNTYQLLAEFIGNKKFKIAIHILPCRIKNEKESLEVYFGVKEVKGKEIIRFTIDGIKSKKDFVNKAKNVLFKNRSVSFLKKLKDIDKKLSIIYRNIFSDYSYIWYGALDRGPDVGTHGLDQVLTVALRAILLSKCKNNRESGLEVLNNLLCNKYPYPIFKRFVLLALRNNIENNSYKKLFMEMIDKIEDLFSNSHYEIELYELLKIGISKFTDEEKEKINKVIAKYAHSSGKGDKDKALKKQKWYEAIRSDLYFKPLYEKVIEVTGEKGIEPPRASRIVVGSGPGNSPLTKENILSKTNEEIAQFLNDFKGKNRFDGPTERGLSETLALTVKEMPSKFADNLKPFLNINFLYMHSILNGLNDAWKEKRVFDWCKLFDFIKEYIKGDFWKNKKQITADGLKVTNKWIISRIADLIQKGTEDDSWAFPEEYIPKAEDILDTIVANLPVSYEKGYKDLVTQVLNTTYGEISRAVLLLMLRKARVDEKKDGKKKAKHDMDRYEFLLNKGYAESYTVLGWYMPNFVYLNKEWTYNKVNEFKKVDTNDIKWQSFMSGYLYGRSVYNELFKKMKEHYQKAINYNFEENITKENLIKHITIGYLRDLESITDKDSLFHKILYKWNYNVFKAITGFFWTQSDFIIAKSKVDKEAEKMKNKIIEFWGWTYKNKNTLKKKLKDKYNALLSDLSRLTIYLDKIDKNSFEWLKLSAPHVITNFNSPYFIEYLNRYTNKDDIKYISKIIIEMLNYITPDFRQDQIISIVEKIYNINNKDEANKICDIYGSRGYEFLRDLYNKHNTKAD